MIEKQKGERLFITGIPASGKTHLAKEIAEKMGGVAVELDDVREAAVHDEKYREWILFYFLKKEDEYLTQTSPKMLWNNLVKQSEALFPLFKKEIEKYQNERRCVVFECVNLLPHIAKKELYFPGLILLGNSYEEIEKRNKKDPRWGNTEYEQELEAKEFFYVERPMYESEGVKYGYPVFSDYPEALLEGLKLLRTNSH